MISGGNIFYDFFQFLLRPFTPRTLPSHKVSVSSLGHDGIKPPNRYGRFNSFDDSARRPRKIPNHHKFRKGKNVIEIKFLFEKNTLIFCLKICSDRPQIDLSNR